ncbi:hypothetical protein PoB_003521200, partial [Plakobranchus ocellatus]
FSGWRDGSSGRAVYYHVRGPRFESRPGSSHLFIASLCSPSTKWVARQLRPSESKGGEESNGKPPQNAVFAKNNHNPTPNSSTLGPSIVLTLFFVVFTRLAG